MVVLTVAVAVIEVQWLKISARFLQLLRISDTASCCSPEVRL